MPGPAGFRVPVADRLARLITKTAAGCWEWAGARDEQGYGRFKLARDGGRPRWVRAHRWVYEQLVGQVPPGLQLDHLCRNRACVNPAHLEPVTNRINWLRGESPSAVSYRTDTCTAGHPFTPENTYIRPSRPNQRECRECKRARRGRRPR